MRDNGMMEAFRSPRRHAQSCQSIPLFSFPLCPSIRKDRACPLQAIDSDRDTQESIPSNHSRNLQSKSKLQYLWTPDRTIPGQAKQLEIPG